jgi:hypothetical protein
MLTRLRVLSIGTLLILAQSPAAEAFLARGPVEMSVEVIVNGVEGAPRSGCEASEEVQTYRKKEWWVAVGEAKSHSQKGWEGVVSGIRCGSDSLERAHSDSEGASGNPYLISGVSTVARLIRQMEDERVLEVAVSFSLQKLSGFEEGERPVYQQSQLKRIFFFTEKGHAFVPLLLANAIEREELGIHEVFVRVSARMLGEESAAVYGVL